jgi:hypothetical protein
MGSEGEILPPAWAMQVGNPKRGRDKAEEVEEDSAKKEKSKEHEDDLVKALNNKELTIMISIMAKLLLQNSQGIREIAGCVWYTFILSASSDFAKATVEAGAKYAETVKGLAGEHTMGPPHVHKWLAAVLSLLKDPAIEAKKDLKAKLTEYYTRNIKDKSVLEVAASVLFFKVKPIFKGKGKKQQEMKIHFAIQKGTVEVEGLEMNQFENDTIIIEALISIGGIQKLGPGPAGQMERLVQTWIERAKKK